MKIVKLALIVCVISFALKHRADIHFPQVFASTPEHMQEHIDDLEKMISIKRQIVVDLQRQAANAPAEGTVVGKTKCGAKITIANSVKPQIEAEIVKIQGEVHSMERELEEATQSGAQH